MRWWWVLVGLAVAATPAWGGECTTAVVGGSPTLGRVDAAARLDFIRERLRHEAWRARAWTWTWGGIYTGLAVGQAVPIAFVSRPTRLDLYVGSTAAFVGLIPLLVMPLKVKGDQRWLERRLATAPPGTHECVLLAEAENLLVRDAKNEAFGRSEIVHVGNVVVNTIIFTILGAGFGHWRGAVVSGVSGIVVGEIQIFTQPIGAVEDLRRYRAGDLAPAAPRRLTLGVAPFVPAGGGRGAGTALVLTF